MPTNVISRRVLSAFWGKHPQAKAPLQAWHTAVKGVEWTGPQHLKEKFGSVDFVSDNRAIFNVGGNKYRVIARFAYEFKTVHIKFVGTHAEYDTVDAATVGNPKAKKERRK
jgi:mRNA interferase HigB